MISPLRLALTGTLLLLIWSSLWGCDDSGSSEQDPTDGIPSWSLEEELRIGREDDSDYALVPVGGIGVTDAGHILVSQPQEGSIRVFDSEGGFVHRIGRRGDGPGEFGRLGMVGALHDTIWAVNCRGVCFLEFFDLEGGWLSRVQVPEIEPPFHGASQYYPLPDGGVVAPSASAGEMLREAHETPWFRWDADGALTATLPGYLSPGVVVIENHITRPDGSTVDVPAVASRPFGTISWMGIAPNQAHLVRARVISGEGDERVDIRFLRFTPDGDTVAMGELRLPPRPIPPVAADSALDVQAGRLAGVLGSEERARRELGDRISLPEYYPPIRSLVVGKEGRTWLALEGADETRWLVLDLSFEPLAVAEVPPRFEPGVVDGEMLWGIERNEFDVPQVVRYRVVR